MSEMVTTPADILFHPGGIKLVILHIKMFLQNPAFPSTKDITKEIRNVRTGMVSGIEKEMRYKKVLREQ